MEERIKLFLEKRSILWNEGKTIALAWFENDELVISRNANEKIRKAIVNILKNWKNVIMAKE